MKRFAKTSIILVLIVLVLFSDSNIYAAATAIPDKIRVGIYYEGSAVSVFSACADNGLQIGCSIDNNFSVLYDQQNNEELAIRKDSYFTNNNNKLTEYNPSASATVQGDKSGPFHIQIGAAFTDYTAAAAQVNVLKQSGIAAYPVYADTWQVWSGFYIDQATAQANIMAIEAVTGPGSCSIIQPDANRIVVATKTGDTILMYANSIGKLQLQPKAGISGEIFKLNGKMYRGNLEIRRFTGSDMSLINIVPLEQYLYGVVPEEIESYSPVEALKAQAIVARTYAVTRIGGHSKWNFDVCSTTHCQMYGDLYENKGGYDSETPATNKAVDDTKGRIVKYNGRAAATVFFASSGGWTEDVENVWSDAYPYLRSVEDKYEPDTSPHYYWTKTVSAAKIAEVTKAKRGKDVGEVTGISINKYTAAKRILELEVDGTKDKYSYPKETFRAAFGLSSNMYTMVSDADITVRMLDGTNKKTQTGNRVVMTADGKKTTVSKGNITIMGMDGQKKVIQAVPANYTFTGKGWGHGVGMSQEGAKGMAKAGLTCEQILQYYYKGITIE